jgi:Ca-activated chloride channel family protein
LPRINDKASRRKYLFYAEKGNEKVLLPLKSIDIKSELRGANAVTNVELNYINPTSDSPLECTYSFPMDKNTILAKFEAIIDDRVVQTKVVTKEVAQERYEDAVASGNTAVLAQRKKKDEIMTVKLGNLLPGQNATLKSQIISQVDITGGYYAFSLVNAFYPDYKKHGVKNMSAF